MDFVSDALATGRALRTFTLIDNYTKESLAIEVGTGICSRQVTRVLERVMEARGVPGAIRCDNGPEFTSLYFTEWCKDRGITVHSHSTWQTGAERACGELQRTLPGRMSEHELVCESDRRTAEDRSVAKGVQRRDGHTAAWLTGRRTSSPKICSELTSRMAATPPDRPSALVDRTAVLAGKGSLTPCPDGHALAGSAPPCSGT